MLSILGKNFGLAKILAKSFTQHAEHYVSLLSNTILLCYVLLWRDT